MIKYDKALEEFNKYVKEQKQLVESSNLQEEEKLKRIEGIDKKVIHSKEVVLDGEKVSEELGFNDSVKEISKIAFLDHDIGRFPQMVTTGNFIDTNLSKSKLDVNNHGELGNIVLENGVMKKQIPETRIFDKPIQTIVNNHVNGINEKEQLEILGQSILKNEDILEIFKNGSEETKRKIIASLTQIVQDVDRLDIYHQILDGRWIPLKTEEEIDPKVFEMFYKGQYLNMQSLREQNLWNPNVGDLVRLGFINQIKLMSVAKMILDQGTILKLKEKRENPKVKDAFDYTNDVLKEMVQNSKDGIMVGEIKKR